MGRIRTIKPEFFTDADLGELQPIHRLLFAGLWCHADRDGRLKDDPRELKITVLPYDSCDANQLLDDLADRGFVHRYEAEEARYIAIPTFLKHQHPNVREAQSTLPPPPDTCKHVKRPCAHYPSTEEGKGKEGKGAHVHVANATTPPKKKEKQAPKPSEQEIFALWFEEQRKAALDGTWTEDKHLGNARLNTELRWVIQADQDLVRDAVRVYLEDPRRRAQDPPCSLLFFSRDRADYLSKAKRGAA